MQNFIKLLNESMTKMKIEREKTSKRIKQSKEDIVASILSTEKVKKEIDKVLTPCDRNEETKQSILNFLFVEESQYAWIHTGEFCFDNIYPLFKIVSMFPAL